MRGRTIAWIVGGTVSLAVAAGVQSSEVAQTRSQKPAFIHGHLLSQDARPLPDGLSVTVKQGSASQTCSTIHGRFGVNIPPGTGPVSLTISDCSGHVLKQGQVPAPPTASDPSSSARHPGDLGDIPVRLAAISPRLNILVVNGRIKDSNGHPAPDGTEISLGVVRARLYDSVKSQGGKYTLTLVDTADSSKGFRVGDPLVTALRLPDGSTVATTPKSYTLAPTDFVRLGVCVNVNFTYPAGAPPPSPSASPAPSPGASPAAGDPLLGSWQGCDGRIVTFTLAGDEFDGAYTALGGLGAYGFALGEVGYRLKKTADGKYKGQVHWKYSGGGDAGWRDDNAWIENGNVYRDDGADGCSQTMNRQTATPSPAASPSPSASPLPVIQASGTFGNGTQTADSLTGNVYFLPEGTPNLPDLSTLQPVGQLFTRELNIPARPFSEGFPGIDNRFEWFALRYTGGFTVAKDGDYIFEITSDDGSKLWVDGNLVIDNDGTHPPETKETTLPLKKGYHAMRLDYFQGPRYYIALQLFVTPPGGVQELWSPSF